MEGQEVAIRYQANPLPGLFGYRIWELRLEEENVVRPDMAQGRQWSEQVVLWLCAIVSAGFTVVSVVFGISELGR